MLPISPDVSLTEFYVVGYRQQRVLEVLTSGNYSSLCADILFSRSMGYYIIQVILKGETPKNKRVVDYIIS